MAPLTKSSPRDVPLFAGRWPAIAALLLACVALSMAWSLHLERVALKRGGQLARPFLEKALTDAELPPSPDQPWTTLELRDLRGRLLARAGAPLPRLEPEASLTPRLDQSTWTFQKGHVILRLPLRSRGGSARGYAILSRPLSLTTPRVWLRAGVLFLIAGLCLHLTSLQRRRLIRNREELLHEIEQFQSRQMDVPLSLPLGNPYKPVVDTLNQLTASRERQNRILTEQHHHQQVLLSNMSEGILVLDTDLRITGVNPVAARWLDLGNPLRIQGERFYTLCRQPRLLSLIDELTSTESLKEIYLRLERTHADDRIVKVRGSPLIDKDQTLGVLILMQDVTMIRRLETLRQDFVANVSHELRTPLTSIKGYAEIILDDPSRTDDVTAYTERILNQSRRMIAIIEDLLALTRIENAESNPPLQATDLKPVLEKAVELCREPARIRDIDIRIHCPEDLQAEIHPPLLEQAIHNILHNAVKYTHAATAIHVRGLLRDHLVHIEIEDQGPGIPASAQPRLFERFYRVDKARSRAIGGTGLGLSIAKHIVQIHQGEIGVHSEPGRGATFWIHLPALS